MARRNSRAQARPVFYEDPSIRRCAAVLVAKARDEIEETVSSGYVWYMARTRVLERHVPEWVRLYGKETADMAVRAIHTFSPEELYPKERRRADEDARGLAKLAEIRKTREPTKEEIRNYDPRKRAIGRAAEDFMEPNTFTLHHLIVYVLATLFGLLLGHLAFAKADTRDAEIRACAEAKTKQERLERGCWRYDAVERNTWRAYDPDAARSWEKPKAWE